MSPSFDFKNELIPMASRMLSLMVCLTGPLLDIERELGGASGLGSELGMSSYGEAIEGRFLGLGSCLIEMPKTSLATFWRMVLWDQKPSPVCLLIDFMILCSYSGIYSTSLG